MAKTRIYNFKFTPGAANAGTVKLQGRINLENILLITNLTRNKIIFNFADATQGTHAWSHSATEELDNVASNYEGVTTLTLKADTSAFSANDKLAIYVEDMRDAARVRMAEVLTDSVDKLRVSQPQSLIDTDFEYSVQPTKWEQLSLVQHHQSVFPKGSSGAAFDIVGLTADNTFPYSTVTATTTTPHGLAVGDVITIQETTNQLAEGTFLILSVPTTTSLTYLAKGRVDGFIFATGLTSMSGGGVYDNSGIPMSSVAVSSNYTLFTKTASTAVTASTTAPALTTISGVTFSGTINTPTLTVNTAVNLVKGLLIAGTGIAANTFITNIVGNTVTISSNLTSTRTNTAATFTASSVGSRAIRVASTTNIISGSVITSLSAGVVPANTYVVEVQSAGTSTNVLYLSQSITTAVTTSATVNLSANASGSPIVAINDASNVYIGSGVTGTGITGTAAVTAVAGNAITISPNPSGQVTGTLTFVGSNILVTTLQPHGLFAGSPIIVVGATATTSPPNGNYVASNVATPNTFSYQTPFATTGAIVISSARLLVRPEGYVQHRSLDGGVQITTNSNLVGSQQIRQTRRYFRYQSGKGLQFSTGVKFTPTFDLENIVSSGTTVTVTTLQDHNLMPGVGILVEGIETATGVNPYNGTFTVAAVTGTKTFTYVMSQSATDTNPAGAGISGPKVTCVNWKGATVRSGLFDDQSGFYFEYDGATLAACRRQSISEMFGKVTCVSGTSAITGTGTQFLKQLVVGDKIVIKGQTYEVAQIASNTSMVINPAFRGPTASSSLVKFTKVQNFIWPQSDWNLDKMDGTGPSGYILDVAKMQMAYIDYTWYGAGHIRYGFRGPMGDIVYVHKVANNNVNTSAYMRSGNLPARFEVFNFGRFSKLVAGATATRGSALADTDTTLYIDDAKYWPSSGTVVIQDSINVELINYTAIGAYDATVKGYPLTGLSRRYTGYAVPGVNVEGNWSATAYPITGTSSSVTFTPDTASGGAGSNGQVSVQFIESTCAPIVSHWGVSVIMDGRYDNDKEVKFTAGQLRYMAVAVGTRRPLFAVRIAPSVDSGIGRNFGIRELINRMQLTLKELGIYSQGQFLVEGVLNPSTMTGVTFPTAWTTVPVGSGSLAQVAYWDGVGVYNATAATATGTVVGGDRVFGVYSENSGGANFSATRVELQEVRDLGTSILSGDGSAAAPCYPNGPDVLVICVTLLEATGTKNIAARMSWTEAQA
jgi:hypothetical protein